MKAYDELEELCRGAREHEQPDREDYEAVARGVAVRLGIAGAIGTTASAAKASAVLGGATKATLATLIVGWGVGGAALGGFTVWALESTLTPRTVSSVVTTRPAPPPRTSPESARESAPHPVMHSPPEDALTESAREDLRDRPAPKVRTVKPAPWRDAALATTSAASGPRAAPHGLEEEARALAEVQRALRDAETERALVLLDRMEERFGAGALGTERRAARVLALCGLGRYEEGRALAEHFIANHPTSPLVSRIRAACR